MKSMARFALFAWFYIGWFGCVFMSASEYEAYTLLFPLVGGFMFASTIENPKRSSLLLTGFVLFSLAVVGMIFDSLMFKYGLIRFASASEPRFLPLWLVSIWGLFVLLLPVAQRFFANRLILSSVLGLIMGPLSYKSGEVFGVLFLESFLSLASYAVFWAIYFPTSIVFIEWSNRAKLKGQVQSEN